MSTLENVVLMDHPWRQRILTSLPAVNMAARVSDDLPLWEAIA